MKTKQIDLDVIQGRADKADNLVSALCRPKGILGSRSWIMSIPARPDYDPDLVISAALKDIPDLLNLVREMREALKSMQAMEGTEHMTDGLFAERVLGIAQVVLSRIKTKGGG